MSGEFTYKPALLRGARTYRLADGVLSCDDWRLPLAAITRAAYVNQAIRGQRMIRLDLHAGDRRETLALNIAEAGWRDDPDAHTYVRLVQAVLRALKAAQPGIAVTVGEYGKARVAMFVIGVLTLLAGIGLPLLALATGVSSDKFLAGMVPMALMIGLGGWIVYLYRPWETPPALEAGLLADVLEHSLTDPGF